MARLGGDPGGGPGDQTANLAPSDQSDSIGDEGFEYDPEFDLTDEDEDELGGDDLDDGAAPEGAEDAGDGSDDESAGADSDDTDPPGGMPPLPEGYDDWSQVAEEFQKQRQQFVPQQGPPPHQVQPAPQPDPAGPVGFAWQPPHELDHELALHCKLQGTEAFKELPPDAQQRAVDYSRYVNGNWDRWTHDPNQFVADVIAPQVVPVLQALERQVADLQARDFRTQHPEVFDDPQAARELLELSQQGVPLNFALEHVELRKQQRKAATKLGDRSARERERRNREKARRGKPARKKTPKNRSGTEALEVPKSKRSDARAIGLEIAKREGLLGEG